MSNSQRKSPKAEKQANKVPIIGHRQEYHYSIKFRERGTIMCIQTINVTKLDKTNFSLYRSSDRKLVEEYYPKEAILEIPSCGGFPAKSIRCHYNDNKTRIFIPYESFNANKVYLKYAMDGADKDSRLCNVDYSMINYGGEFIKNYKFKGYTKYCDMFEKGQVSWETKERFFTEKHASVCKISPNHIGIKCGEDKWKVKYDPSDKKYVLMHNNYEMINDDERVIEAHSAYHIQGVFDSMEFVVNYICDYSFTAHVEAVKETRSLIEGIRKKESNLITRAKIWFESRMLYQVRSIAMQAVAV